MYQQDWSGQKKKERKECQETSGSEKGASACLKQARRSSIAVPIKRLNPSVFMSDIREDLTSLHHLMILSFVMKQPPS